jgi:hypothetical protein
METEIWQEEQFADIYERSNLTKSQLLFWSGQKLRPEAPLYNMVGSYVIPCKIDPDHLQEAFKTLINSSDALRTVIEERNGVPYQRVVSDLNCAMEYVDLSDSAEANQHLRTWIKRRSQMIFDLSKRLIDYALIKVSDDLFVCYINNHQIIGDAWAGYLIYRRVAEFYELSLHGQLNGKEELLPFGDYVEFESKQRRSTRHLRAEAYWKQKLAERSQPIRLYGVTPANRTTRGRRVACYLNSDRVQKLKTVAQQEAIFVGTLDLSLFILFVSFLFVYIYLVSGSRRLSLGVLHHNRVT